MPATTPWLLVRPNETTLVYLWALSAKGSVRWEYQDEASGTVELADDSALSGTSEYVRIDQSNGSHTPKHGKHSISLIRFTAGPTSVRFRFICDDVVPFLLSGPGIVPSHFPSPGPSSALGEQGPFSVWFDIPAGMNRMSLQAILAPERLTKTIRPDATLAPILWWMPEYQYHVAEFDTTAYEGWWELPVAGCAEGDRLTIFEGLPLFLAPTTERFPYARAAITVTGSNGPVAARIRALRDGNLAAVRDLFPGETAQFWLVPGLTTIATNSGMRRTTRAIAREFGEREHVELAVELEDGLAPDPGWYAGDHHMHSYYEDGGQSPEAVARAARANGLDYFFLTDLGPEPLLAAGLAGFSEPGVFLAMPGQEAMNPDVHCNALNTARTLPAPAYGDETPGYPGPDEWVRDVAQQVAEGAAATLMLNHPSSHSPASAARHAYFRAWWVADEHPEIRLVENFDLGSWYERLNQGRRLTGLWTTDTHDVVLLPPGMRRTYVKVDGTLTEQSLISALESGHCFNTREPGALLYLTVNDAIPGETAAPDDKSGSPPWRVVVRCVSSRPLSRIDLICQGETVRTWSAGDAFLFEAEERLSVSGWVLATAQANEEPASHASGHGHHEPLIAFTNPVWIGG